MTQETKNPAPLMGTVYAVPRRYDLATLFVVSLAYALLFGVMRAAGGPPTVFALIAGYVTVIGLSQALLFRGKRPRTASVLVGVVCALVAGVCAAMYYDSPGAILATGNPCTLMAAGFFSYLVGALIGGVFLVADGVRRAVRWLREPRQ